MYSASNFLASFISTSKTLQILHPDGSVSFTIIVCNFQKASVTDKVLNLVFEGAIKSYSLIFSSNAEANQALIIFTQAVDALIVNCGTGSGGGSGTGGEKFGLDDVLGTSDRAFNNTGSVFDIQSINTSGTGGEWVFSDSENTQSYTNGKIYI